MYTKYTMYTVQELHFFIIIYLSTLTFILLTISGTRNFAYGLLILLQIPLRLLILTL